MKVPSLMHTLPRFPGGCQCYMADVQGTHKVPSQTVNRGADADLTEGSKYWENKHFEGGNAGETQS